MRTHNQMIRHPRAVNALLNIYMAGGMFSGALLAWIFEPPLVAFIAGVGAIALTIWTTLNEDRLAPLPPNSESDDRGAER